MAVFCVSAGGSVQCHHGRCSDWWFPAAALRLAASLQISSLWRSAAGEEHGGNSAAIHGVLMDSIAVLHSSAATMHLHWQHLTPSACSHIIHILSLDAMNFTAAALVPSCHSVCVRPQAIIEGLGITLNKMTSPPPPSMPFQPPGMPGAPPAGVEAAGTAPPPLPVFGAAGGDAAAAAVPDGSESGSSGGGWFSWLTGSEEQKVRHVRLWGMFTAHCMICLATHVLYSAASSLQMRVRLYDECCCRVMIMLRPSNQLKTLQADVVLALG